MRVVFLCALARAPSGKINLVKPHAVVFGLSHHLLLRCGSNSRYVRHSPAEPCGAGFHATQVDQIIEEPQKQQVRYCAV